MTPASETAGRPDARAKLHGAVRYGTDLESPGMLWGALVPAPRPSGAVRRLDLSAARALPGVVAIGPDDLDRLLPPAYRPAERPLFAAASIDYGFQPIAAVAAPTRAGARAAAEAVRATVDPAPVVADVESIFPDWPGPEAVGSPHVAAHVHAVRGDVDAAFRDADRVVRETYRTASVHQVALEPHACLARVDGDRWTVRTSTQSPFGTREDLATMLGLPESAIEVAGTWVGGGFGGKGAPLLEPYALLLARASGRPVRLALDYAEEFRLGRTTLPAVVRMETAVRDGTISGRRVRLLLDVGAALPGRDFATGYSIGFLLGPYRTPTFEVEGFGVRTHKPPFGPHRAPFAPQCAFVVESHLDHVAREVGLDSEAFRAAHLWREGEATPLGQPVGPFGLPAAFERARATARAWRAAAPPGHGVGVAGGFWSTGTGAGGELRLRLAPSEVVLEVGEREIGSGSVVAGLRAVAVRVLGLPADRIRVESLGTAEAPFDSGVFGSRTVAVLGRAIEAAAAELRSILAARLGAGGPVEFGIDGERIHVRADPAGGRIDRPLADLLTPDERGEGGVVVVGKHYGRGGTIDESLVRAGTFYGYTDFTGAAHVAEVAVDRATGAVRVVRYTAFQDVGTLVDPPAARAQVEGGIAMGLGTALTEEAIWSDDGRLLNPGLLDYRIPTFGEVPPIEVEFLEGFPGAGPFGAKGLGEPPIIPVPAAIALAVREACGAHATELPVTAERTARALKLL